MYSRVKIDKMEQDYKPNIFFIFFYRSPEDMVDWLCMSKNWLLFLIQIIFYDKV